MRELTSALFKLQRGPTPARLSKTTLILLHQATTGSQPAIWPRIAYNRFTQLPKQRARLPFGAGQTGQAWRRGRPMFRFKMRRRNAVFRADFLDVQSRHGRAAGYARSELRLIEHFVVNQNGPVPASTPPTTSPSRVPRRLRGLVGPRPPLSKTSAWLRVRKNQSRPCLSGNLLRISRLGMRCCDSTPENVFSGESLVNPYGPRRFAPLPPH